MISTNNEVVFDIEADNLLMDVTKLHCLSYRYAVEPDKVVTLTDDQDIGEFFVEAEAKDLLLIGHFIIGYDLPTIHKLLNIKYSGKLVDTLPLSWYLHHDRLLHGLDNYGEEYGVPKPKVTDWSEQPIEVYVNRCQEDTLINYHLWVQLKKKLQEIYQ
tara:strand:+ start:3676 stop:4149 length:474 start_codon:yes stop_codon:yes gene_type:complete